MSVASEAGHEFRAAQAKSGAKRVTEESIEDGGASGLGLLRASAHGGGGVNEGEDVVETVVDRSFNLVVCGLREGPVVAGSDRRSAGLCRAKLKGGRG